MLEFWFDPNVPVSRKFSLFGILVFVTAVLYWLNPLSLMAILMCLGTGIIFLICRYCKLHFAPTQSIFTRVLHWIPIALIIAIIFMQLKHGDILILGAQGIGFMALAICLFSPFSLLKAQDQ
ncbi:hypothetical protein [uncultured Acinetobacter sp.]|uniref:hypothetical protein n=1 Tax=uncultured Acinetobacter sp. TaxID=165433 RepID=UPI002631CEFE|nr:hypothetical protein [uncultured Acinetobacter sp.]